MKRLSSFSRLLTLAVLGVSLTGCVVLPFGGRGHGGGGWDRHHWSESAPSGGPSQQAPGRGR